MTTFKDEIREEIKKELLTTDGDMARICEDAVQLLVNKGILRWEELGGRPMEVIARRKELRKKLQSLK
jgi:hypothetical protein